MNEENGGVAAHKNSLLQRIGLYAAVLLVVFLLGLLPMWLAARNRAGERDEARRELRLSRMQDALGAAAIDARRGEYEAARLAASDFFTALHAEAERTDDRALNAQQIDSVRPMLAQRDDAITLLARSDPAAADRLSDLYVAYRKAMDGTTAQNQAR